MATRLGCGEVMELELVRTRKLIDEARAGRREAYEALFRIYCGCLRQELRRGHRLPPGRRVEESDVVQQTLLDAVQHFRSFEYRGRGSFRRWLIRILDNRVRMAQRYSRSKKRNPSREATPKKRSVSDSESAPSLAGTTPSPSEAAMDLERRQQIEHALVSLSPDHREVIRLVKLREMSLTEVAHTMDRSENAVKKLLARALLQLREVLREKPETEEG